MRSEVAIDLDGDDMPDPGGKWKRQCAPPWSNLKEYVVRRRGLRFQEPRDPRWLEEVLAEPFSRPRKRRQSSSSSGPRVSPRQYRSSMSSISSSLMPK